MGHPRWPKAAISGSSCHREFNNLGSDPSLLNVSFKSCCDTTPHQSDSCNRRFLRAVWLNLRLPQTELLRLPQTELVVSGIAVTWRSGNENSLSQIYSRIHRRKSVASLKFDFQLLKSLLVVTGKDWFQR